MAHYALSTSYAGETLLSGFNWFDGADPSHGFVSYQSRSNAESMGLYSVDENTGVVRLGVDSTNTYSLNEGRPSIRLESKEAYNHGLFVADFLHMPPSQCGLWPAFWSYGPNWPAGGEVDIIEGANDQYGNVISGHTTPGCTVSNNLQSKFSGVLRSTNCDVGTDNVGCGYSSPADDTSAYGDGFNAANGGVYAMEWDDEYIKIWHFARSQIPSDIDNKEPDPSGWGLPDAIFGGDSCDVDNFFKDMSLVININFCGDWGNAIWGKTDGCGKYAPTCNDYVANNPQAFSNAYWDVRYIDAYQKSNKPRPAHTSPPEGSESVTQTTMTTTSTTTVTVGGHKPTKGTEHNTAHIPKPETTPEATSSLIPRPSATSGPNNPIKVDDSAYLGCFSSSDGFKTFNMIKDSKDMTIEMCVKLCHGSMFAGIYDTQCFCADSLDANTRATSANTGGVCDHPCPGNDSQHCGGLAKMVGDVANTTGIAINEKFAKNPSSTEAAGSKSTGTNLPFINSTVVRVGNSTLGQKFQVPSKRTLLPRVEKNILLTVYGAVKDETPPPLPPPMAPGQNVTYTITDISTATRYKTVIPVQETEPPHKGKFVMNKRPDGLSMPEKTLIKTVRPTEVVIEECTSTEEQAQPTPPPPPAYTTKHHRLFNSSRVDVPTPVETTEPATIPTSSVVTAGAVSLWSETKLAVTLGLAVLAVAVLL